MEKLAAKKAELEQEREIKLKSPDLEPVFIDNKIC